MFLNQRNDILGGDVNHTWFQYGAFEQRSGLISATGWGLLRQGSGRFTFTGGTVSGGVYVAGANWQWRRA